MQEYVYSLNPMKLLKIAYILRIPALLQNNFSSQCCQGCVSKVLLLGGQMVCLWRLLFADKNKILM